jgi:hypothetical protein
MVKVPTNSNITHDMSTNTVYIDSDDTTTVFNDEELTAAVALITKHKDPLPAWAEFKRAYKLCSYTDFINRLEWNEAAYKYIVDIELQYRNMVIDHIECIKRISDLWAAGVELKEIADDLGFTKEQIYDTIKDCDIEDSTNRTIMSSGKNRKRGNRTFTDNQEETIYNLKYKQKLNRAAILIHIEREYGMKVHHNTLLSIYKRVESKKKAIIA